MKKEVTRSNKKHNRKRRPRRRRNIEINPAVIAFVCALLGTLTIGGIALGIAKEKQNSMDVVSYASDEESSTTRLPYAEKIMTDSPESDSETLTQDVQNSEVTTSDIGNMQNTESDNTETGDIDFGNAEDIGKATGDDTTDTNGAEISEDYWNRTVNTAADDCFSLAFAGDILFDPGYSIMGKIKQNGGAISGVIGQSLLSYMQGADITVVNNEFPYSTRGTPTEGKTFTFRAEPSSAALLNDMGVDAVTLANNHAYDYGADALVDSLTALDNVGVVHLGAGNNIEEASHPIYYTSQNGIKVAIISATQIERLDNPDTKGATDNSPGVFRCLDITRLLNRIKEAKDSGAFVVVCIHWGTENKEEIDWWQEKQAPEIVGAGADLIIGAHPHILQKIDYINGVPVVYSLGNYLFNSTFAIFLPPYRIYRRKKPPKDGRHKSLN